MPEPTLAENLQSKHPDYAMNIDQWVLYTDVTTGEWDEGKKNEYLVKGRVEPDTDYATRVQLTEFLGESETIVKRLVSELYKDMPTREFGDKDSKNKSKSKSKIAKFADVTNRAGESIDIFMQDVADKAITYGACHILIDMRAETEAPLRQDSGIPFAVAYTPIDIWDWDTDPDGNLFWARIVEIVSEKPDTNGPRITYAYFREFTRTSFTVYKAAWNFSNQTIDDDTDVEIVAHGDHNLGIVPIVSIYPCKKIKPMIGRSFIAQPSRGDIKKFRLDSDLRWDIFMHAHPFLAIWMESELEEKAVGSSTYLHLKPQRGKDLPAEDAKYLTPPATVFDAAFRAIGETQRDIKRLSGLDPDGALSDSSSDTSGVGKAWSFSTSEGKLLAWIADKLEQGEFEIFRIASMYVQGTGNATFNGTIRYPDTFDLVSVIDLIRAYVQIGPHIQSEIFHRSMQSRISRLMVGDVGQEDFNDIDKEIKKAIDEIAKSGVRIMEPVKPFQDKRVMDRPDTGNGKPETPAKSSEPGRMDRT